MLTREQCIKLKEWGYPQGTTAVVLDASGVAWWERGMVLHLRDPIDRPDPEELILWLGDKFCSLECFTTVSRTWYRGRCYNGRRSSEVDADTPLAAVYALCEAIFGGNNEH